MNSPPDPGSPISTDSSDSPLPEEINIQPSTPSYLSNFSSHIQTLASGPSKRRHGGGSGYAGSASNRDPKTRRRGEPGRHGHSGGLGTTQSIAWGGEAKREERDLVDNHVVEYLRKEIGDPFQERDIKRRS